MIIKEYNLDAFKLFSLLTKSEFIVLLEVMEAKSNKQIARDRLVTINTIKTQMRNIYRKLDMNKSKRNSFSKRIELMNMVHGIVKGK